MFFQISLCKFHKNILNEWILEGKAVTLWDEITEHKAVSQKSVGFQISIFKFHKNSLSERLLEGKAVTLWDELTEHKAVSQKASIQFLTEDISFFPTDHYELPNIILQTPQEQS